MSWKPSSYEFAARRRQLILDLLHAAPGAQMPEIRAHLAAYGDTGNAANTLRTMADWRELRFEGDARSRRYYALVATTRSADESVAIREANCAAANAARKREATRRQADGRISTQPYSGRIVHTSGAHPIPNQGGQGACRPRVYVNCGGHHA